MKALVLAVPIVLALPAAADESSEQLNVWREVTFTAPMPCMVVCPYWLDVANADVDGNGEEDIAFNTCGNVDGTADAFEGVPGIPHEKGRTFDEVLVGPRPSGATVLIFAAEPLVNWDLFICRLDGAELSGGANLLCNSWLPGGDVHRVGCAQRVVIAATPETVYLLRAYNWSDVSPLDARYCFSSSGICEEAT